MNIFSTSVLIFHLVMNKFYTGNSFNSVLYRKMAPKKRWHGIVCLKYYSLNLK